MDNLNQDQLGKAIMEGDILTIKKYLEYNDSFNNIKVIDPNGFGRTPLELAAIAETHGTGYSEATKMILANSKEEIQAEALIGFASEDDYINQVNSLLEAGIKPDIMNKNSTALQRAVGNKNPKIVYLLLSYGADPEKEGEYGSALEIAGFDELHKGMLESAINGNVKSPYYFIDLENIKTTLKIWANSIQIFSRQNSEKEFYVFGIDAGRIVANTEDEFIKTLKKYKYKTDDKIQSLRYNPGDFSFHIPIIYDDVNIEKTELDFSFLEPQNNESRIEKELLRDGLIHNKETIFKNIKTTSDFKIYAFKHIY